MVADKELTEFIYHPTKYNSSEQKKLFKELNRRIQRQILKYYRYVCREDLISNKDFREYVTAEVVDRLFLPKRNMRTQIKNLNSYLFQTVQSVAIDRYRKDTSQKRAKEKEVGRSTISLNQPLSSGSEATWEDLIADEEHQNKMAEDLAEEVEKFIDILPKIWRLILRIYTVWGDPLKNQESETIAVFRGVSASQIEREQNDILDRLGKIDKTNVKKEKKLDDLLAQEISITRQLENARRADSRDKTHREKLELKLKNLKVKRIKETGKPFSPVIPTAEEVASLIGLKDVRSAQNVRIILFRARKKIKKYFEKRCNES